MKIKVTGGWSLGLEEEERRYTDGETFDAPDVLAEQWIAAGQAVAVKAVTSSPNKAVLSSPNKAVVPVQTFTKSPEKR